MSLLKRFWQRLGYYQNQPVAASPHHEPTAAPEVFTVLPQPPRPQSLGEVWQPESTLSSTPTVVIGLGEVGYTILAQLESKIKQASYQTWPAHLRLLCLDTAQHLTDLSAPDQVELLVLGQGLFGFSQDVAETLTWWQPLQTSYKTASDFEPGQGFKGKRQMGRLSWFQDEDSHGKKVQDKIRDVLNELVTTNTPLQVMLITSVSDGVGSAILFDLAELIQTWSQTNNQDIKLATFLLIPATHNNRSKNQISENQQKLNGYACLRELNRFLLTTKIFGNCFFFEETALMNQALAQATIQATIADILLAWFTVKSQTILATHLSDTQGAAGTLQERNHEAIISSMGSFAYHLPMVELREIMAYRYVIDLIQHYWLKLETTTTGKLALNRQLKYKGLTPLQTVLNLLRQPLYVAIDGPKRTPPAILAAVATFAEHDQWDQARINYALAHGYTEIWPNQFVYYLAESLLVILNGGHDLDLAQARQGKLGYGVSVVEILYQFMQKFAKRLAVLQLNQTTEFLNQLQQVIQSFQTILEQLHQELTAWQALLIGEQSDALKANDTSFPFTTSPKIEAANLFQTLQTAQQQQLAQVTSSLGFNPTMIDQIYENCLKPHLEIGLNYVWWQFDEPLLKTGHFELNLLIDVQSTPRPLKKELAGLAQQWLQLGRLFGRTLWEEHVTTYLSQLSFVNTTHPLIPQLAQGLLKRAEPSLSFRGDISPQKTHFLTDNRSELGQALTQALRNNLGKMLPLPEVTPYHLSLITVIDNLPLSALTFYQQSQAHYLAEANRQQCHVFAAEQHAVYYEELLPSMVGEAIRILHPQVVQYLEHRPEFELFVRGWGYGYIQPVTDLPSYARYQLQLPIGAGDHDRYLNEPQSTVPMELVLLQAALKQFVLTKKGYSLRTEALIDLPFTAIATVLDGLYTAPIPQKQEEMGFLNQALDRLTAWQETASNPIEHDLLILMQLVLLQEKDEMYRRGLPEN